MHELAIAQGVVEIASGVARENGATRVTIVRVRIGVLAGIAPAALAFGYDVSVKGTLLEGSQLIVEPVPAIAHCLACQRDTESFEVARFVCGVCGTPTGDVRGGRELQVESIEVI